MDVKIEATLEGDNVEELKKATEEAVVTALDEVGMQAATLAQMELQNNPSRIDTGLLRNSITHAVSGKPAAISEYQASNESKYNGKTPEPGGYSGTAPDEGQGKEAVYIGTNVEYAAYVHEGTDRMAPNRFLKNAIERNKSEFEQIISQVLRDLSG